MSDTERYDILKNKIIYNIPFTKDFESAFKEPLDEIKKWKELDLYHGKEKRSLIQKIASEFGTFEKEYKNDDIGLVFDFSRNNFKESYNKQKRNYTSFAKIFSIFDEVIKAAVGIEVHNRSNYKIDPTLNNVYVLASAYQDGEYIVPVKLEIKEFKDKKNALYVAISLNQIKKTEVWKQGITENGVAQNSRSVNISISEYFRKINPLDESFLKYIPDGFLDAKQKEAKRIALEKEKKKYGANQHSVSYSMKDNTSTMQGVTEAPTA